MSAKTKQLPMGSVLLLFLLLFAASPLPPASVKKCWMLRFAVLR